MVTTEQESIPWRRILVEVAAIVSSILLAFAIDRGYENYQAGKEEWAVLSSLRADLEVYLSRIPVFTERFDDMRNKSIEAIEILNDQTSNDQISGETNEHIIDLLDDLYGSGEFDPQSLALAQIESSGRADLISDAELRGNITEMTRWTNEVIKFQDELHRIRQTHIIPTLFSLGIGIPSDEPVGRNLPKFVGNLPDMNTLRRSRISNELRLYAGTARFLTGRLRSLGEATEAVIARLDELLE